MKWTDPSWQRAGSNRTVYGKTRADVREKLNKAPDPLDAGAAVKDSKRTLADWLAHWRATTLAASDRKESTRELYANLCRRHLVCRAVNYDH